MLRYLLSSNSSQTVLKDDDVSGNGQQNDLPVRASKEILPLELQGIEYRDLARVVEDKEEQTLA